MNLFELFIKIGVDDQASGKLSDLSSKLGSGLQTAAKVGTAAVAAVGGGIAALGTYAAKVGGDFEAQMSKVSAISGATGDDLQALEDKAKQLGIDTKFSATEAGQAFEYMAMAGWKTEQMLDGVAGIMDLAAASGEDLAMVSDIVTDAMTAFGLSADQSTHFADVLAQASSNANTNVALLGESFKYVAPVAGALGYSVEDTATALGLMANAGIKGSQAGTALRAALSSMLSPSENVAMAMGEIGLLSTDVAENFVGATNNLGEYNSALLNNDGSQKSLIETMEILRDSFSGLTEAQQAEYAATIFGREAMSGMLAIINASDADFEKLTNSIYNADGAAKNMAVTMANNLQGQLTLLKSSTEGFDLALYDKIQVPLTEMASWAVDSLNQLTTAFNDNGVDGIVEAAGNILSAAITTVVDKLPVFVELAVSVTESFVNGLSQNQETLARGAISIITTLANGLLNMLPQIAKLGLDLIVSFANGIAESLPELIPTIIDVILQIVDTLTAPDTLSNLLEAAIAIIIALADGLIESLPELIEKAPEIVQNLVDAIIDNAPKLLESALVLVLKLVEGILSNLPELVTSGIEMVSSIIEGIVELLGDLVMKGKDIVDSVKEGFSNKVNEAKTWGKDLIQNFIDGITAKWNALKQKVASVAQTVKDYIGFSEPKKGPLSNFHTYAPDMMELFAQGIRDNEGMLRNQISKSFDFSIAPISVDTFSGSNYNISTTKSSRNGAVDGALNSPMTIIVQSVLDGKVIGETAYQYSKNKGRMYGMA